MKALLKREGERSQILSPGVGRLRDLPEVGALLGEGAIVGRIIVLGRIHKVTLPPGISGVVQDRARRDHEFGVGYGELLFEIAPIDATGASVSGADESAAGSGGLVQRAASDGVFYRRPSPDAPFFVEAGSRVERGQPIGLLEVMKTFSQVLYGGDDLPDSATVDEVLVDDGTEIEAGQPILRLTS